MVHVPYNPTVRLACRKCQRKTDHVMTDFSNDPASALTLLYECQECCSVKKVFELNTLPELKVVSSSESPTEPSEISTVKEPTQQTIPIERGPQIER